MLSGGLPHAQWWSPDLKPKFEANQSSVVEGADGAISAWVADERNHISGQELRAGVEEMHADLVNAGKTRERDDCKKPDVYSQQEA